MRLPTIVAIALFLLTNQTTAQNNLRAPGPTFTFGQNILKQGTIVIVESLNYFETMASSFFDNVQDLIIGVTDNFSITGFLPIILQLFFLV